MREAIIQGKIGSGQRITETSICEQMNVSRVVVRESILMLIGEGLLVKERNRYTKVLDFDAKDVADLFDLRIAIEQAAAKRCIDLLFVADELTIKSDLIMKNLSRRDYDQMNLMKCDIGFHSHLIERSGNARLASVWKEILGPLFSLLYRYMKMGIALHYSHEEIIQALRSKDEDTLMREIKLHIDDTKNALLDMLNNSVK